MKYDMNNKSIQELENDFWPDQKEYPSNLIERCHDYRKIPIYELQIHQIVTLLIQDIGADFLMPIVIDRMANNILEEDDYDGRSFIWSIDNFSDMIWRRNPKLYNTIINLIKDKQITLEASLGIKGFNRLLTKMEMKNPANNVRL